MPSVTQKQSVSESVGCFVAGVDKALSLGLLHAVPQALRHPVPATAASHGEIENAAFAAGNGIYLLAYLLSEDIIQIEGETAQF